MRPQMLTHPTGQRYHKKYTMGMQLQTKMAAVPGMSSANVFYTYILNHFANIIYVIISFI